MRPLAIASIAEFCGGSVVQGDPKVMVENVSTDTRTVGEGELFVALHGERFDAHDFAGDAALAGARCLMVDREVTGVPDTCGIIRVNDTLAGLQMLARSYRDYLDPKVVGITGSNGKTSTKDMVSSVLRRKFRVNATAGNLNNHIGLPLTILKTSPADDFGVFEMGMSNPGEIEVLADIAQPDIGIITNVGVAHIEFMKTRDAIALEKGMLAEAVGRGGHVVLNGEDDFTRSIAARCKARVITAGFSSGDFRAERVRSDEGRTLFSLQGPDGSVEAEIPVLGRHMVLNALLAAAAGAVAGMSLEEIREGLAAVSITGGRLQMKKVGGLSIVDDSYNANPDSMRAAVDTLAGMDCGGRRFAILGVMAELGNSADEEHRKLGGIVRERKIDVLVSVGDAAREITANVSPNGGGRPQVEHFSTHEECADFLRETAGEKDLLLLKGSRSARMESVLEALQKEGAE